MNTQTKHVLNREYDGANEMSSVTPTCSCGWKGRAEYAYNDYQHTNVREQESEHVLSVRASLRASEAVS
jgi:hypothetical protein